MNINRSPFYISLHLSKYASFLVAFAHLKSSDFSNVLETLTEGYLSTNILKIAFKTIQMMHTQLTFYTDKLYVKKDRK